MEKHIFMKLPSNLCITNSSSIHFLIIYIFVYKYIYFFALHKIHFSFTYTCTFSHRQSEFLWFKFVWYSVCVFPPKLWPISYCSLRSRFLTFIFSTIFFLSFFSITFITAEALRMLEQPSTLHRSQLFNFSSTSWRRILHKDSGIKSHKFQLLQELKLLGYTDAI